MIVRYSWVLDEQLLTASGNLNSVWAIWNMIVSKSKAENILLNYVVIMYYVEISFF